MAAESSTTSMDGFTLRLELFDRPGAIRHFCNTWFSPHRKTNGAGCQELGARTAAGLGFVLLILSSAGPFAWAGTR